MTVLQAIIIGLIAGGICGAILGVICAGICSAGKAEDDWLERRLRDYE